MNDEFKKAFSNLSISEKRNQIINEMMIIAELIKMEENNLSIPSILNIKNYNSNNDKNLNESEMLDFLYEGVYNIQKELITIFQYLNRDMNS